MKNKFNLVFGLLFALILVPQIAFASWWNPFSWRIFQKKAVAPTESHFTPASEVIKQTTNANLPEFKKSALAELESKTTVQSSKATQTPTPAVEKAENFTTVAIQFNEKLIATYQNYIGLLTDYKDVYSKREQQDTRLKTSVDAMIHPEVAVGVNVPNDTYRNISALLAINIKFAQSIRVQILDDMISKLNATVSQLATKNEQLRNTTKVYTREEVVAYMEGSMKLYDVLDKYAQTNTDAYTKFSASMKDGDAKLATTFALLERNAAEYSAQSLRQQAPTPLPQLTMQKPQIPELPKTTFCTMSYTGINGNYNITCN